VGAIVRAVFALASRLLCSSSMTTALSLDELASVVGGAATKSSGKSSADPLSGLSRAAQEKPGKSSIDIFGYANDADQSAGIGVEARHRFNPNISVFGQAKAGVKDGKPDDSVMGGIRFEW
jgi:hypothetical protein